MHYLYEVLKIFKSKKLNLVTIFSTNLTHFLCNLTIHTSYLVLITVTGNSVAPANDLARAPKQKDSIDEGLLDLKINKILIRVKTLYTL